LFSNPGDLLIRAEEQFCGALHAQESQMLHGASAKLLLTPLAQEFRTASDFGGQQLKRPFERKVGNHFFPPELQLILPLPRLCESQNKGMDQPDP
jgi:hypothetical protein